MKRAVSKSVVAVILGGGAGSRLHPLTSSRSKPAVPIAGKYRLVDIPISNCINSNISRMFVLTQYNSTSLNKHIKNTYHFSAFGTGFVDILAAEQTPDNSNWFQGTADAVRQSLKHIFNFESEYILILSGDQLYQMDFEEMVQKHIDGGFDITLATIPVAEKEASDFGILKADENNFITSFIEKPKRELLVDWTSETGEAMRKKGKHYLASMGIYIFNRDVLSKLLLETHPEATDFGKEIIPNAIENQKVGSYQYEGYWEDIGQIASFFEANLLLTDEIPLFNLFDDDNSVYTRPRMLPPAKISGTTLEKTLIAEGSIIHASRIEHSVI
ncbi:MAG: glucose-1-phosphate adenylyltransferase, partial [Chitinophagaceae bacterium]|nr:glucose-1-phosphate adenylyltransferase [Chitinophagaceae bacterium]